MYLVDELQNRQLAKVAKSYPMWMSNLVPDSTSAVGIPFPTGVLIYPYPHAL